MYAVEVHAPVIEFGPEKTVCFHVLTEDHIFPTIDATLAAIHARADEIIIPSPNSKETVS